MPYFSAIYVLMFTFLEGFQLLKCRVKNNWLTGFNENSSWKINRLYNEHLTKNKLSKETRYSEGLSHLNLIVKRNASFQQWNGWTYTGSLFDGLH